MNMITTTSAASQMPRRQRWEPIASTASLGTGPLEQPGSFLPQPVIEAIVHESGHGNCGKHLRTAATRLLPRSTPLRGRAPGGGVATVVVGDGADSGERVRVGRPPHGSEVVALLGVVGTASIVGDKVGTSTTGRLKMGPKLGDESIPLEPSQSLVSNRQSLQQPPTSIDNCCLKHVSRGGAF